MPHYGTVSMDIFALMKPLLHSQGSGKEQGKRADMQQVVDALQSIVSEVVQILGRVMTVVNDHSASFKVHHQGTCTSRDREREAGLQQRDLKAELVSVADAANHGRKRA